MTDKDLADAIREKVKELNYLLRQAADKSIYTKTEVNEEHLIGGYRWEHLVVRLSKSI